MIGLVADRAFVAQAFERRPLMLDRAQSKLVVFGGGLRILLTLRDGAGGGILIA